MAKLKADQVHSALAMITIAALVYVSLSAYVASHMDERTPVVIHYAWFTPDVARAGEWVELHVDRTRVRYCPGSVAQLWYEEYTGDVRQMATVAASPSTATGRLLTTFEKRVPPHVGAGVWCYRPMLTYTCEDGPHYVEQQAACLVVID